jgi:endoglucanase
MKTSRYSWFGLKYRAMTPLLGALAAACAPAPQPAAPPAAAPASPADETVVVVGTHAGHQDPVLPPPPNVRVNQVGYLPGFAKYAVAVNASTAPLGWELVDSGGKVVSSGQTKLFGPDADSGDHVHQLDFSDFSQVGKGYKLRVGQDESYPFDVAPDVYHQLKYDAIWYFYHNRSGIEIAMPYAGDPQWTRPAGHLTDQSVPCAPDAGCKYSLDVSGGWYDAGDHGKYVVNGGISLWTLHNLYERLQHLAPGAAEEYADGKLRIPENQNGRSDLLDEARWELEWMLKMQVPEGKEKAGMAHHKVHDAVWTSLGFKPPTDIAEAKIDRYLRPVSTAATLNLAATAAQGARIWKKLDPDFSGQCRTAAERAWQAAQKFPNLYAKATDKTGGGPYDDQDVTDEFYWAAAELYITTNQASYRDFISKSPHYLKVPETSGKDGGGAASAMTWQMVQALGTISLSIVPNKLGKAETKKARDAIVATADQYLGLIAKQGYRLPMRAENGKYPWGSNSFTLNNQLILALAHDFTQDNKYLVGVLDGMNYILGVNAMGFCYVSGYGERPLQNPHHRVWAHQLSDVFPPPPPGCVSGGPNSSLQDPKADSRLKGCKPQKCYIDHIQSWSTNEITINWNAPLSWITAFIDEQAKRRGT